MSTSRIYCRLCAEEKPYADIASITTRKDLRSLIEKLSTFGIYFVDLSNKMLPNTVCITCYGLLVVSYEFFVKVKRSQVILREMCGVKVRPEIVFDTPNHEVVKAESDDGGSEEYLQDFYSPSFEDVQSPVKAEKYKEIKLIKKVTESETPLKDSYSTWDTYPWQCGLCDVTKASLRALRKHCTNYHLKCSAFKCADCSIQCHNFEEFVEHVRCHRISLRNICPYCNIDMGYENISHIEEHSVSLYPCTLCGELFENKRQLRTHQSFQALPPTKKRKGPLPKDFTCKRLPKDVTCKRLPKDVTCKRLPKDVTCKRLPKVFTSKSLPKDSTCKTCGMVMKTPATMKNHLKMHTDRKRDYTCDRCGKAYYTKGYLDVHYKIHNKNTKESCKICQKTFLTLTRLKKHVKTHNFELPYQCDECKRLFSSKDRLREHVKVHMDIKPFQCQYCSKKFRHKSIMKTHENQHTGARPYSCNICCMDFANWSNCNKHMKRKHGTTLAKNVMTPHGKLALNPMTGKPEELVIDNMVKEWSLKMLKGKKRQLEDETVQMESL